MLMELQFYDKEHICARREWLGLGLGFRVRVRVRIRVRFRVKVCVRDTLVELRFHDGDQRHALICGRLQISP